MSTDSMLKAQGAEVKWGLNQINNPTPKAAKIINNIVATLVGVYGLLAGGGIIPADIQTHYNPLALILPAISTLISKTWGWDFASRPQTDKP